MSLVAEADFGLSLLREASLNQTTVLSPISVALALSLVHLGAKGSSKEQIKNTLCRGSNDADCATHFSTLQKSLAQKDHPYLKNWVYCSKPGNISCVPDDLKEYYKPQEVPADFPLQQTDVLINIANRVFASNNIKIKKAYRAELASKFDSTLQNLDFSKADKAAEIVNEYVKNETAGKIDKLVGTDSFNNGKHALLVNAVYFHGRWENTFEKYSNKRDKFYEKVGVSKEVTFMKLEGKILPLVETSNFVALGMIFKNTKYRLTIALPKKRFGLAQALNSLAGDGLQKLITNRNSSTVNVSIPKFKIDSEVSIQNILKKIGITDPFTEKANLSGITDSPARLGDVKHKVTIDVNERGTTAAASTAVEMVEKSDSFSLDEPISFVADHPFLFVLSKEGHILFTGQYYG